MTVIRILCLGSQRLGVICMLFSGQWVNGHGHLASQTSGTKAL